MIKQHIGQLISKAIEAAQRDGLLPVTAIPELGLEHPPQAEKGDFASSVAMKLSRAARMNPLQIAKIIAERITSSSSEVAKVEVAPPGFINFYLDDRWIGAQAETVLEAGDSFGSLQLPKRYIQIEFVSANPVGPLHVGNGRGAVLGDTLANVLSFAGHRVQREYYINDAGVQIRTFARTLLARYRQAFGQDVPLPEDGYAGQYMVELAEQLKQEHGSRFIDIGEEAALIEIAPLGMAIVLGWIRRDAEDLGVKFDGWFSEKSLFDDGLVDSALGRLRESGRLAEREGAVWFTSTSSVKTEDGSEATVSGADDKDNVVIRSNGSPTYFASDIAYHHDKLGNRKFDTAIDIWGADHHGHVSRMKSVVEALGFDPDQLVVILYQLVTLKRGGELVRISKRTGDIITLREVIDEVGADACRYFFLARSADSQMDFDLAIAKEQSDKNPVYYIQYAHARIASILRRAEERGIDYSDGDTGLLELEPELTLIRKMLQLPELVELAAEQHAPHVLPHYAVQLAASFHSFYKQCRVVSDIPDELGISKARLKLVAAAKIALANTLRLMGMSTPERMDRAAETEDI